MIWSRRKLLRMLGLVTLMTGLLSRRLLAFSRHKQSSPAILSDDVPPESPITVEHNGESVEINLQRFSIPEIPLVIYYPEGMRAHVSTQTFPRSDNHINSGLKSTAALHSKGTDPHPKTESGGFLRRVSLYEPSPMDSENSWSVSFLFPGDTMAKTAVGDLLTTWTSTALTASFSRLLSESTDPSQLRYPWARKLSVVHFSDSASESPGSVRISNYLGKTSDNAFIASVSLVSTSGVETSWDELMSIADIILSNLRLRSTEARMR